MLSAITSAEKEAFRPLDGKVWVRRQKYRAEVDFFRIGPPTYDPAGWKACVPDAASRQQKDQP
jgi:hypothetical protein